MDDFLRESSPAESVSGEVISPGRDADEAPSGGTDRRCYDELNDALEGIEHRVYEIEKKIGSMKLSSADTRSAKRFAKEIFNSYVRNGHDFLYERLRKLENEGSLIHDRIDKETAKLNGRIEKTERKNDALGSVIDMLMLLNGLQVALTVAAWVWNLISATRKMVAGKKRG